MDGIYLRFLNSDQDTNGQFDRLTDPNTIDDLFEKIDIGGGVKLGTALDDKLFAPFVQDVANGRKRGELVKPRITMIVTESEVSLSCILGTPVIFNFAKEKQVNMSMILTTELITACWGGERVPGHENDGFDHERVSL